MGKKSLLIDLSEPRIKSALKLMFDVSTSWAFIRNQILCCDSTQTTFCALTLEHGYAGESLNDVEEHFGKLLKLDVGPIRAFPEKGYLVIEKPHFEPKIPQLSDDHEEMMRDLKHFHQTAKRIVRSAKKEARYFIDRYEKKHQFTTVHLNPDTKHSSISEFVRGINLQSKSKLLIRTGKHGLMMSGVESSEPLTLKRARAPLQLEIVLEDTAQAMLINSLALAEEDKADISLLEGNLLAVRIFRHGTKGTFFKAVIGGKVGPKKE